MHRFVVGEHALLAVVHRLQHADAGMQQRAFPLRSHDQRLYGGLPAA
jgi:hypothetical protein